MSAATTTTDPPSPNGQAAGVIIAEGVVLILLGIAAAAFPRFASFAAAVLLGWVLIACGIAGLVSAFSARPHVHFLWSLFSSIVSLVAGFLVAYHPLVGVFTIVVLLAAWLALDRIGPSKVWRPGMALAASLGDHRLGAGRRAPGLKSGRRIVRRRNYRRPGPLPRRMGVGHARARPAARRAYVTLKS
jgi:hypothetical protein